MKKNKIAAPRELRLRLRLSAGALLLLACGLLRAAPPDAASVRAYVQMGATARQASGMTVGLVGPWLAPRSLWGGELTGHWDAHIGHLRSTDANARRQNYTALGLLPTLRWRLDEGRSPWFIDAGIGLTYFDGFYQRGQKRFSTQVNFDDRIGVGRNFGAGGRQEWSVQLQHVSNADIKQPNPGENFVLVRYVLAF